MKGMVALFAIRFFRVNFRVRRQQQIPTLSLLAPL